MNRSVIIGAVLVAAAGLGYYQLSYLPGQRAAEEAAAAAAAAEAAAAEEAARKAAEEAAAAAAAALDPATFDAARVVELIEAAPLDETLKAQLRAVVRAAETNPNILPSALRRVKEALGM